MKSDAKSVTPFVSKVEVARRRGLSRMGVYRLIARGLLPVDDAGRIPRADFELLQARIADRAGQ